jgi:hypothetical protein
VGEEEGLRGLTVVKNRIARSFLLVLRRQPVLVLVIEKLAAFSITIISIISLSKSTILAKA